MPNNETTNASEVVVSRAFTLRHKVTRGDIERRMAEHPPLGYTFVDCNWKKRKAKFVNASGALKFVSL
jgi:hypothetical protein